MFLLLVMLRPLAEKRLGVLFQTDQSREVPQASRFIIINGVKLTIDCFFSADPNDACVPYPGRVPFPGNHKALNKFEIVSLSAQYYKPFLARGID